MAIQLKQEICYRCTWDHFEKGIQNTSEETGDFIGNKIADKTKVSKHSTQNT